MRPPETLVIACGVLARELLDIVDRNGLDHLDIECLPVRYHHRPSEITPAVRERIERAGDRYARILIGYADCGTGGHLDSLIEHYGHVERLPGAHCFEFYAGADRFAAMQDDQPGTLYLTDFFVRHFDWFLFGELGLDRHPELLELYFGNYTRAVYLAQRDDADLGSRAQRAADRLGLDLEVRPASFGELESTVVDITTRRRGRAPVRHSILDPSPARKAC